MTIEFSIQLSVVVPVYQEAQNIEPFLLRTEATLASMQLTPAMYEIIFCLDPSLGDETQNKIQQAIRRNPAVQLIIFSRRFGQPAATLAGLFASRGKSCVAIDVDLQDPPELIADLYKKLKTGYDVVYAKRRSRKGETLIKRVISRIGYKIIHDLTDVHIPPDAGDFRIMSRRVINELKKLHESHGFLRGLVAYVGFKQTFVEYDRDERKLGVTHYNRFTGSLKIGLNGLIGFSSRPLQYMSIIGAVIAGFSFLLGSSYVVQKIIGINLTPGLSTTVLVVTFFSGIQLLCLGLMGEYIGRIYDEVKRRPLFIIDKIMTHTSLVQDKQEAKQEAKQEELS